MTSYFKKTENEDLKISVLKDFYENPHILQYDNDEAYSLIKDYSLNGECLIGIRKKLLLQGAIEAERIEPRVELGFGYAKTKPPVSWDESCKEL